MENKTSKILIETQEDKRLEVAVILAKTVNNLTELLKNMEISISNIHINGINVQTAPGETALQIGNNVKNTMVSNSIFKTDVNPSYNCPESNYEEDEDEDEDEDNDEDEESNPIQVTAEVNPLVKRMMDLGLWSKTYYNLTHYEKDGKHLVTAQQHWTWDFMVGEGDSLDEALNNLKVVINMYDKEFRSVYESIKKRFNTDYTPPTRAEIFNEMPADEHFNSDMFDSKEEQEEWRMNDLMLKPVAVDDSKVRKLEKAFENVSKENQKYLQLRELLNDILKDD